MADLLEEKVVKKAFENGTYVSYKVSNAAEVYDWMMKNNIVTPVDPTSLHVTVAYSHVPFEYTPISKSIKIETQDVLGFTNFDGAFVLELDSSLLQNEHNATIEAGAQYDDVYRPHITLSHKNQNYEHLKTPEFAIQLNNISIEPLNTDWESDKNNENNL